MLKKTQNQWQSSGISHPGRVRTVNEDAFLDQPQIEVWAVADGMGGHAAGEIASRTVVEALANVSASDDLNTLVIAAEKALLQANQHLVDMALAQQQHLIGSTAAVLVSAQKHIVCLWVGDSRIYRYRNGVLQQLTQDHAVVEDMVQVGLLARDAAEQHPHANRITRAIGADYALFVDLEIYTLRAGDRFLLCSDGLYKELSKKDIARVLATQDNAADCSKALLDKTLARGARDNTSIVVINYN